MDLTKKEYEDFIAQKKKLKNIFDVLVLLYSYIDGKNKNRYMNEYSKFIHQYPDYWEKIELLNNEMLEGVISFSAFIDRFWELLSRENVRYYALKLLISCDRYVKEGYKVFNLEIQKSLQHKISILGPMNTDQTKYSLYLMPQEHFFKDHNSKNPKDSRIRFIDQSDFNRIDSRIQSYKIIKTDRLDEKVEVIGYNSVKYALPQRLKIALIPMSPCKWFKEHNITREDIVDDKKEEVDRIVDIVITDNEENTDRINEAYVRILEKCIEENVQIVVFPELARNKKTLEVVKDFLSQHMISVEHSLELIFLGSFWEDGGNEGVLFNGSGTELLRVYKRHDYVKIKDGVEYREKIVNTPDKMTLIDISGLGRIEYSICKDGLDAAYQNTLWAVFEISLSVISAYSESLSHFTNLGRSFSTQYGGIQILANSCASRMEKNKAEEKPVLELGNMIMPCACSDDMSVCEIVQKYETMDYCWDECIKKAGMGCCIRVVSICPDETGKNSALSMSLDNIIL